LDWLALLDDAGAVADGSPAAPMPCPAGTIRTCDVSGGTSLYSVDYHDCTTATASGHGVVRDGVVVRTVGNTHFCQDGLGAPGDTDTIELRGYEQTETAGVATLAHLTATLTLSRTGQNHSGCAGADVDERIDGTLAVECSAAAESLRCPARGAAVRLGPES